MANDSIHDHFTAKQIEVLRTIAESVLKLQQAVPAPKKKTAAKRSSAADRQKERLAARK